jgi:hypothetical protein
MPQERNLEDETCEIMWRSKLMTQGACCNLLFQQAVYLLMIEKTNEGRLGSQSTYEGV